MSKFIQFLPRSKQHDTTKVVFENGSKNFVVKGDFVMKGDFMVKGDFVMKKYLLAIIGGVSLVAAISFLLNISTRPIAAQVKPSTAVFESDGKLKLPTGYRAWVFVGAPLTPDGLNNGKAGFPEYHNVYIEKHNVDAYLKTGSFPEGTVIVKEMTRVVKPTFPDGSRTEPSGRGYFNGEFNGMDVTMKDSK